MPRVISPITYTLKNGVETGENVQQFYTICFSPFLDYVINVGFCGANQKQCENENVERKQC